MDEWSTLVTLIRAYAARRYGLLAVGFSIRFLTGEQHYEMIPPLLPGPPIERKEKAEG